MPHGWGIRPKNLAIPIRVIIPNFSAVVRISANVHQGYVKMWSNIRTEGSSDIIHTQMPRRTKHVTKRMSIMKLTHVNHHKCVQSCKEKPCLPYTCFVVLTSCDVSANASTCRYILTAQVNDI